MPRNMAETTQKSRRRVAGKKSKFGCWGEGPPETKATAPVKSKDLEKPSKIFEAYLNPGTEFRKLYERGDLPVRVEHGARKSLRWKVDKGSLDYMLYLPIFFDGLREKVDPYAFLAEHGTRELLRDGGAKILPVVPQLVLPVKHALDTKDPDTMCRTLKALQDLVQSADMVGAALVPYYRQMLPVLNLFINKNCNIGDAIEYGQMKRENLGDLIAETLSLMEQYGGEDAYINIKYMIPTYESYVEAA